MTKIDIGLVATMRRECGRLCSRPIYLVSMVLVPLGCLLFLISLMGTGLPLQTPVTVVDNDHSQLSRQMIRSLDASQMVSVVDQSVSFHSAMDRIRRGEIFGFAVIPHNFQEQALSGGKPTVEFYSNMTYFIPGTLSFKGFKTVGIVTSGGVMRAELSFKGLPPSQIGELMQPVVINTHAIGNPWLNYSYYLTPSFGYALIAMMMMIVTVYSITSEIKYGTSVQWLATARNRISVALAGKLLPQTFIFIVVVMCAASIMFGYCHFPMNGNMTEFAVALVLFVLASQALAVFVCSLLPNPRLAFSVVGLLSVLSFSFTGLSFPVESMYGAIAIFNYIMPIRYLFLIYANSILNGFDIYYVRMYYVALILFIPIGYSLIFRLRKACLNPVYIP